MREGHHLVLGDPKILSPPHGGGAESPQWPVTGILNYSRVKRHPWCRGVTHKAERGDNMSVPKTGRKLVVWRRTRARNKRDEIKWDLGWGNTPQSDTYIYFLHIHTNKIHIYIHIYMCVYIRTHIYIYGYKCICILSSRRIWGKECRSPGLDFPRSTVLSWISTLPHSGSTKGSAGDSSGLSGRLFDFLFHSLLLWIH